MKTKTACLSLPTCLLLTCLLISMSVSLLVCLCGWSFYHRLFVLHHPSEGERADWIRALEHPWLDGQQSVCVQIHQQWALEGCLSLIQEPRLLVNIGEGLLGSKRVCLMANGFTEVLLCALGLKRANGKVCNEATTQMQWTTVTQLWNSLFILMCNCFCGDFMLNCWNCCLHRLQT